jgi:prepilin-type N-terminal cleavage/methylation domain-containing protein
VTYTRALVACRRAALLARRNLAAARPAAGFTLIEVLLVLAVTATTGTLGLAVGRSVMDEVRSGMAARYLESRIMYARLHALRRSARVGLRFEASGADYRFTEYVDGNGNGVRTADIAAGIDPPLSRTESLGHHFSGISFGLLPGVPEVESRSPAASPDGVRIGTSRILTLGPDGTATAGTLYVHGRRGQYAVRVLGATGRARILRFDWRTGQWIAR